MSKIPSTGGSPNRVKYPVIKDGAYPARYVKFVGLGLQEQPEFQGKKKGPAFKAAVTFELAGKTVIGVKADGSKSDPAPSCVFLDFFIFPGATRGKCFDFCQSLDPTVQKVPDSLDWFIARLGAGLVVTVGHYVSKQTGESKNTVRGVGQPLEGLTIADPTVELLGFDPYSKDEESYGKLLKFHQEDLAKALDASAIPLAGSVSARRSSEKPSDNSGTDSTVDTGQSDDDQPF